MLCICEGKRIPAHYLLECPSWPSEPHYHGPCVDYASWGYHGTFQGGGRSSLSSSHLEISSYAWTDLNCTRLDSIRSCAVTLYWLPACRPRIELQLRYGELSLAFRTN